MTTAQILHFCLDVIKVKVSEELIAIKIAKKNDMRGLRSQNSAEYVVCRMQSIVNESPSMLGAGFV